MAGRFIRLMVVCVTAVLLAGCLSIDVDKTETTSAKVSPTETSAEAAD